MAVADISHCAFYSPQLPLTLGPSLSQKIHKMHVNFYVSFSRAATPPSPRQDPNLSHGPAPTLRTLRGEAWPRPPSQALLHTLTCFTLGNSCLWPGSKRRTPSRPLLHHCPPVRAVRAPQSIRVLARNSYVGEALCEAPH